MLGMWLDTYFLKCGLPDICSFKKCSPLWLSQFIWYLISHSLGFSKLSHWRVELWKCVCMCVCVCVFGPCDRSWGPLGVGLACSEGSLATFHLWPSRSLVTWVVLTWVVTGLIFLLSPGPLMTVSLSLFSLLIIVFLLLSLPLFHHIQPSVIWQFLPGLCNFPAHIVHSLHCIGRGWMEGISKEQKQTQLTVAISHFRKDLKFVSDIEKEMEALVEAVNKVEIKISNSTCF